MCSLYKCREKLLYKIDYKDLIRFLLFLKLRTLDLKQKTILDVGFLVKGKGWKSVFETVDVYRILFKSMAIMCTCAGGSSES